jgi:hypothetical protein
MLQTQPFKNRVVTPDLVDSLQTICRCTKTNRLTVVAVVANHDGHWGRLQATHGHEYQRY